MENIEANRNQIIEPNLIIGEGIDEKRFLDALAKQLKLEKYQILPIGGKDLIHANLKILKVSPDFPIVKNLSILRDADNDAKAAFDSVCRALRNAKLPVPLRQLEPTPDIPYVRVMILPGGESPGMLEDLCLQSVSNDASISCLDQFFECLRSKQIHTQNDAKARLQAFLSSREKPGLRLGEAAEKGYWPWDHVAFSEIKEFLRTTCMDELA